MNIEAYLYRLSLEEPTRWAMCFSPGIETERPYLNIGNLLAFVDGYATARPNENDGFFLWLRDTVGVFPGEGWARHHLELASGDHQRAIGLFFERLHQWALETRPTWFTEFNQLPRGSLLMNGLGEHLRSDVRLEAHVRAVTGAPPTPLANIHVSGAQFGDGFRLTVGLPKDVATARTPTGRRVVVLGDESRTPRGELQQPLDDLKLPTNAIALDVTPTHADVVSTGDAGIAHIRHGHLLDVIESKRRLELISGDRLLLVSPVLFAFAKTLPLGQLRSQLATADSFAWGQAIDTPQRRLCVVVELGAKKHVVEQPRTT